MTARDNKLSEHVQWKNISIMLELFYGGYYNKKMGTSFTGPHFIIFQKINPSGSCKNAGAPKCILILAPGDYT